MMINETSIVMYIGRLKIPSIFIPFSWLEGGYSIVRMLYVLHEISISNVFHLSSFRKYWGFEMKKKKIIKGISCY